DGLGLIAKSYSHSVPTPFWIARLTFLDIVGLSRTSPLMFPHDLEAPAHPGLSFTRAASSWRMLPSQPRASRRSRASACDGGRTPTSTSTAILRARRWP